MSLLSSPLITLEMANSGRSRCKEPTCLQAIAADCPRIQVPMFVQGRTLNGNFHLNCFLTRGVSCDVAMKGNAGKCKLTKRALQKGDFRFRVHAGSAKFNLSLNAACKLMKPILEAAEMSSSEIVGAGEALTNSSNPEAAKVWNELVVFGNNDISSSRSSGSSSSGSSSSSSGGDSNAKKVASPKKAASSPKKSAPSSPAKITIGSAKLNSSPPRRIIGGKSSDADVVAEARAYQANNCPAGKLVEVDGVVGKLPRPLSGAMKKSGAKGGMRKVAVKAAAKAAPKTAVKKSGAKK